MSIQGTDISWGVLRQVARDWAGSSAELVEFKSLSGGSISTTLALTLADGKKAVLKITPHRVDRAYADEEMQLRLMRQVGLPTPEVYALHIGSLDSPFSYLLMEFVQGADLATAKGCCNPAEFDGVQAHLAELLARLHEFKGEDYRRVCCGDVKCFAKWPEFYRDVFDPIWTDVAKSNALPVKVRKTIGKLHDRLDYFLPSDGRPRLLHWDVWSSNVLAHPRDGKWQVAAILDPMSKFGDPEAELAYLELFHTATPAFFKAYQTYHKLPPDYHRLRKPIYQLYSLMNDLHLFGGEYLKPVLAAAEKVSFLV